MICPEGIGKDNRERVESMVATRSRVSSIKVAALLRRVVALFSTVEMPGDCAIMGKESSELTGDLLIGVNVGNFSLMGEPNGETRGAGELLIGVIG